MQFPSVSVDLVFLRVFSDAFFFKLAVSALSLLNFQQDVFKFSCVVCCFALLQGALLGHIFCCVADSIGWHCAKGFSSLYLALVSGSVVSHVVLRGVVVCCFIPLQLLWRIWRIGY